MTDPITAAGLVYVDFNSIKYTLIMQSYVFSDCFIRVYFVHVYN